MKNIVHLNSLPVVDITQLLSVGINNINGLSIYNGVMIFWDEDYDIRVLEVIDIIKEADTSDCDKGIVAIFEHEGTVSFLWEKYIPIKYEARNEIQVGKDNWVIDKSIIIYN